MPKPISSLNLFPTHASREAYEQATGKQCPPWNPARRPKAWFDPNAKKAFTGPNGVPYAMYGNVYVAYDQTASAPVWDSLGLPVDEAKAVNIPPRGEGQSNVPGADQPEVPCPCRPLADSEVIRLGFGAVPQVWTADEIPSAENAAGFTGDDRALLKRIASKLGV